MIGFACLLIGLALTEHTLDLFGQSQLEQPISSVPQIRLIHRDWGSACPFDVERLLTSVAEDLFPLTEKKNWNSILVGKSSTGPIVLFQRGKKGEYLVNLNANDQFWCRYAFQFAHEIGHIICGFNERSHRNLWFEESICEVFSLYALHSLSDRWERCPPYPNWQEYAQEFSKYAEKRMTRHSLTEGKKFSDWYLKNVHSLSMDSSNHSGHSKIATKLYPLFLSNAHSWSSCVYLNDQNATESKNFRNYLLDWKENCPKPEQKKFVNQILDLFDL